MDLYRMGLRVAAALASATALIAVTTSAGSAHAPMLVAGAASMGSTSAAESAFLQENARAMSRMMAAMAIKPSGDVDRDFVAAMIPHHQGAIDMAQAVLRHGRNEQLRRIAQEIIVDQTQEIAAMRLALGESAPASAAVPTGSRK
jgi:uncharacterized protein (DUF305 family)